MCRYKIYMYNTSQPNIHVYLQTFYPEFGTRFCVFSSKARVRRCERLAAGDNEIGFGNENQD